MTKSRADEIVKAVIYRHLKYFDEAVNGADIFRAGRAIGMMQKQLELELEKEIEPQERGEQE